jgi:hypothetical protein
MICKRFADRASFHDTRSAFIYGIATYGNVFRAARKMEKPQYLQGFREFPPHRSANDSVVQFLCNATRDIAEVDFKRMEMGCGAVATCLLQIVGSTMNSRQFVIPAKAGTQTETSVNPRRSQCRKR